MRLSKYEGLERTMDKPQVQELRIMHATLCKAIADPTRIALLYELGESPKHVNQLVEALKLPQATVSRHLKMLRERSMVYTRREGSYVFYTLADQRILDALDLMRAVKTDILNRHRSLAEAANDLRF